MPELEAIMQEWPPELEALLRSMHLPTADLVPPAHMLQLCTPVMMLQQCTPAVMLLRSGQL
jgi:hypothetical protein